MLTIKDKAEELGISVATLRRWHKKGLLIPDFITLGVHRRYKTQKTEENRQVIRYSRVSSSDQKEDLGRQSSILQLSCVDKVIEDVGSGLNFSISFNVLNPTNEFITFFSYKIFIRIVHWGLVKLYRIEHRQAILPIFALSELILNTPLHVPSLTYSSLEHTGQVYSQY